MKLGRIEFGPKRESSTWPTPDLPEQDAQQEAEARRQAKREYVEAMREAWRRKHGWRDR